MQRKTSSLTALLCALALSACDSPAPSKEAATKAEPKAAAPAAPPAPVVPAGVPVWTGDYPSLAERRVVRMLVVYSKTFYFIDKGQQRGITYDMGMELEKHLNANNKDKTRPIRVVFIPVARDKLLPALAAGIGDIATGGLTITPERSKQVDFTAPAADEHQRDPGHGARRGSPGLASKSSPAAACTCVLRAPTTKVSWR